MSYLSFGVDHLTLVLNKISLNFIKDSSLKCFFVIKLIYLSNPLFKPFVVDNAKIANENNDFEGL